MIVIARENSEHFEMEEMGEGRLRVRYEDRVPNPPKIAETYTQVESVRQIYNIMVACHQLLKDLAYGTPQANQNLQPAHINALLEGKSKTNGESTEGA